MLFRRSVTLLLQLSLDKYLPFTNNQAVFAHTARCCDPSFLKKSQTSLKTAALQVSCHVQGLSVGGPCPHPCIWPMWVNYRGFLSNFFPKPGIVSTWLLARVSPPKLGTGVDLTRASAGHRHRKVTGKRPGWDASWWVGAGEGDGQTWHGHGVAMTLCELRGAPNEGRGPKVCLAAHSHPAPPWPSTSGSVAAPAELAGHPHPYHPHL